jgi:DNA-binding SARP family transcriptional activator
MVWAPALANVHAGVSKRAASDTSLSLLSGFDLMRDRQSVRLPLSMQRLLAFLTIQDRPRRREYVSGVLWLESPEQRAGANLRSALWRLNQIDPRLVEMSASSLRLSPEVKVDLHQRLEQGRRLLDGTLSWSEEEFDTDLFKTDLLPDWYDDWLVIERERFHQMRLRVLELICELRTGGGRFASALDAGLAAVAAEPLRESAHRALIKVHLVEGNRAEAVRQYELYRRLLSEQLGLAPSRQMVELVRG